MGRHDPFESNLEASQVPTNYSLFIDYTLFTHTFTVTVAVTVTVKIATVLRVEQHFRDGDVLQTDA